MLRFIMMTAMFLFINVAVAEETLDVIVYDATGKPASGVKIDVVEKSMYVQKPETVLKSVTVGDDGKIALPVPPKVPGPGEAIIVDSVRHMILRATDPSGQKQEIGFPSMTYDMPSKQVLDSVYLAFVPRDAVVPAFRGKVVDSSGSPLPNGRFSFHWMEFPGVGGQQFQQNAPAISAASDGTFSVGIPKDFLLGRLGVEDMPASSALRVSASAAGHVRLLPDRDNVISIAYTENVKFQLVDIDGNPIPVSPGSPNMSLYGDGNYIQTSKKVIDPAQGIIDVGPIPLPADYTLKVEGRSYTTRRIEKGAGNGPPVRWTRSEAYATIKGRVLSAEDGTGLSNVYIISSQEQGTPYRLVKLGEEELRSIWSAWAAGETLDDNGSKNSIKLKNGQTIFDAQSLSVSDAEGKFQLHYESGQTPSDIHVYVPGRLGASASLYRLKKENLASSETILPDVSLPLAAEIKVIPLAPEKIPDQFLAGEAEGKKVGQGGFQITVGFERPGPWRSAVPPLNGNKDNPWTLITSSGWVSPGNHVNLLVPAGVKVTASVDAPYRPTLGVASWQDIGPLQPGEKVELPAKTVPVKTPFLIKVKNKDGTPAIGMSVRIDGQLPLTTDKEGAVIGWSSGRVGRIQVMPDNGWEVAAEAKDIDIPQTTDVKEVELILK